MPVKLSRPGVSNSRLRFEKATARRLALKKDLVRSTAFKIAVSSWQEVGSLEKLISLARESSRRQKKYSGSRWPNKHLSIRMPC